MIHLVLDAAGEQAVTGQLVGHAARVLKLDGDGLRAGNFPADPGKRETALLEPGLRRARGDLDLGVGQHQGHEEIEGRTAPVDRPRKFGVGLAQIDDTKLQRQADLLGGEANAAGIVHRLEHFLRQPRQPGVKVDNLLALGTQNGFVIMNNSQRHRSEFRQRGSVNSRRQINTSVHD